MSEEHLNQQFSEKKPSEPRILNLHEPQVVQDLYFLARTDLQGNPKALWDFYLKFTSPKREDMLQSFAEGLQKESPITFIRLVEQTVDNNSKTARRDSPVDEHVSQEWQEWRRRMYREYPPILFPGEEGNRRWDQAISIVNNRGEHRAG